MYRKRSAAAALAFLAALLTAALLLRCHAGDEDRRFEAYTHDLFCQEVASNSISLHYTLRNPSAYGITHAPVSIGSCTTDTGAVCASVENALAVLESYDPGRLSEKNRLTYEILKDYYTTQLSLAPYMLYEEPLAPFTGTQSQLPVVLSEYHFYTAADIDTYLELLTKIPGYFRSILDFERARAEKGLLMSPDALDSLCRECDAFVRMQEDNYLYSSFSERLDEFAKAQELSAAERKQYIKKNASYIEKYVFPAYRELEDGIRELCEDSGSLSAGSGRGLCSLPDGAHYYELLAASETGSSRSISQLQELTRKQIIEDMGALQTALAHLGVADQESGDDSASDTPPAPTSDLYGAQGIHLEDSNPLSILAVLQQKMADSFPAPPSADVQVKYVKKSMEEYLSPAFYMIPALDNTGDNVIYINPGHMPNDLTLFTTLAHEGYPGHLYQNVYYMNRDPDPVRCLLNYGGYTEGWATYAEMLSYYYAPVPKDQAALMQKNTSILLGLYALADMGIHHDGWSPADTKTFFAGYGITNSDAVEEIYNIILLDPANYLKYYIGYLEFLELKKDAIREWGEDFSQKRFHRAVLEVGPAPFKILREQLMSGQY